MPVSTGVVVECHLGQTSELREANVALDKKLQHPQAAVNVLTSKLEARSGPDASSRQFTQLQNKVR